MATLNKEFKQLLRNYYGFETIKETYSIFGVKDANQAYNLLFKEYEKEQKRLMKERSKEKVEQKIKKIEQKFKEKKAKALEKKQAKKKNTEKKYYQDNVIVYDGKTLTGLYDILLSLIGKSIVISVFDKKGGEVVSLKNFDLPNNKKDFIDWWKSTGVWIWEYPTTIWDDYPNAIVYIYLAQKNIDSKKIKQYFKEGNVNCLIKPIITWATECKESSKSKSAKSRYNVILEKLDIISKEIGDKGVSEQEMVRISQDCQIDISIESPIQQNEEKFIVESKSSKKPLKHMIMRNTRFNHVDINEFLYLNNIKTVTRDELYKIRKELIEQKTYFEIKKDNGGIYSINTLEQTWTIENEFMTMANKFEVLSGLIDCKIDDINDAELTEFVKMGTHYNATVDLMQFEYTSLDIYETKPRQGNFDINKINHMDMKAAYMNFGKCSVYQGFLGKITDWRSTDKIVAVGLYQVIDIVLSPEIQKLDKELGNIYVSGNVYPSPELEWLQLHGCTFKVVYGCWGVETLDLEEYVSFCEPILNKEYEGVKGYAKYFGMCDSHKTTKTFTCFGDKELADTIPGSSYFGNNEITIRYPKKHNFHLGHITAFITMYQRIQVLDQLLTMNLDNVIRVCVDGIYYYGDEKCTGVFRPKTEKKFGNVAGTCYISNVTDEYWNEWQGGSYKPNTRRQLFIGAGGNGKTHKNLTDKGYIRPLYIAHSWDLARDKGKEYGIEHQVWYNILSTDPAKFGPIKRFYNVFIIDEVSMMTNENKEYIFKTYPNIKLIFCGDVGYQAPPFSIDGKPVTELNEDNFDIVREETTNYRFKCDKIKELVASLRNMIKDKADCDEAMVLVKNYCKYIPIHEVEKLYTVNDTILCRSHRKKDQYTEIFEHLDKWYVTTNTREYKNGQIIIGPKPNTTCEKRHAYTIHSIQGRTIGNKLFIDISGRYDIRILYTAISRAKSIDQIYLTK